MAIDSINIELNGNHATFIDDFHWFTDLPIKDWLVVWNMFSMYWESGPHGAPLNVGGQQRDDGKTIWIKKA